MGWVNILEVKMGRGLPAKILSLIVLEQFLQSSSTEKNREDFEYSIVCSSDIVKRFQESGELLVRLSV